VKTNREINKIIDDLRLIIKNIPTSKKIDRARRGAYVDCLNRLNKLQQHENNN